MRPRLTGLVVLFILMSLTSRAGAEATPTPPNIVYILCDDLGYGDVHALNPQRGKIPTPNIDRLAGQGMTFTDAHGGSSVCSPTRYGILTGRYAWRTRLQRDVLIGNSLPLIAPGRLTVASLLKQHGYATACFGKWHLGLQFSGDQKAYRGKIVDGPLQHGFDRYFGISASLDMAPFAFIDHDHFTQDLTATKTWMRTGPAAPDFEAVDVLRTLTRLAVAYIKDRTADAKAGKPFFLYLPLASPHTPLVPTKQWQGKSFLGTYGDFVMQTDSCAGEVIKAIDDAGLTDNTLLIFTSDNGFATYVGPEKLEKLGHFPSAQFRGYKSDIWDGGHRIPFIVRWPARVKANSRSDQLICLGDLLRTCADLFDQPLPDNAGEDSVSILPALTGTAAGPLREAVIHHSAMGKFAIRQGNWKLELCPGSGGWDDTSDAKAVKNHLPFAQLYDMSTDIGEGSSVLSANPEVVARLTKLLQKYVADGRSTPGKPQKNDVPVDIFKTPKPTTGPSQGD